MFPKGSRGAIEAKWAWGSAVLFTYTEDVLAAEGHGNQSLVQGAKTGALG